MDIGEEMNNSIRCDHNLKKRDQIDPVFSNCDHNESSYAKLLISMTLKKSLVKQMDNPR